MPPPCSSRADEVIELGRDFRLWHIASVRGSAAIRPESGVKQTSQWHRSTDANDHPERTCNTRSFDHLVGTKGLNVANKDRAAASCMAVAIHSEPC